MNAEQSLETGNADAELVSKKRRPMFPWEGEHMCTGESRRGIGRGHACKGRCINTGYTEVIGADLSGYFDSIPHHALMKSLARRISDGVMLALLKAWLEMPVEEEDERGGKRRTTQAKDRRRGSPQGAPISPLLTNLYMRRFILGWRRQGWAAKWAAHIVSYADDYVILCRHHAQEARKQMEKIMERIGLTVNPEKTRICRVPEQSFDFLGYTFGLCYKPITGRSYLGTQPSKKRVNRLLQSVSERLGRNTQGSEAEELVSLLNRRLRGWANYFCLGSVSRAYRAVDRHGPVSAPPVALPQAQG
ncbi:reverse transcriptase domain-containing protein, partial [Verrucomicrobium sp. 3C]|uniref:reverse transcriptase domain-containing protein n=1 Tax=Verrucomicrobium sp. 3C TaxID=1134055 RepID=UPI0021007964